MLPAGPAPAGRSTTVCGEAVPGAAAADSDARVTRPEARSRPSQPPRPPPTPEAGPRPRAWSRTFTVADVRVGPAPGARSRRARPSPARAIGGTGGGGGGGGLGTLHQAVRIRPPRRRGPRASRRAPARPAAMRARTPDTSSPPPPRTAAPGPGVSPNSLSLSLSLGASPIPPRLTQMRRCGVIGHPAQMGRIICLPDGRPAAAAAAADGRGDSSRT